MAFVELRGIRKSLTSMISKVEVTEREARKEVETSAAGRTGNEEALPPPPNLLHDTSTENFSKTEMEDEDIEKRLLSYLNSESLQLTCVCVYGMGSTGKTTLAKKLNDSPEVLANFYCLAWVRVSQFYQIREILLNLYRQFGYRMNTAEMLDEELAEHIYKRLRGKRFLIVLDNLWSADVWSSICIAFPSDNNRSRILITTRNEAVADALGKGGMQTERWKMSPLADKRDWESFRSQAGLDGVVLASEAEQIGKKMITLSRGVPLARAMLANMLKAKTADEWKVMLQSIARDRSESQDVGVKDVLNLCYYSLPEHLRSCLLYLGNVPADVKDYNAAPVKYNSEHQIGEPEQVLQAAFPELEDSKIEVDTVCQLWIAEGLVSMKDGETMMNVAARYLDELAKKSWIQKQEDENLSRGRFKFCRIHHDVRDFCRSKGDEEKFFNNMDLRTRDQDLKLGSAHRLAIYLGQYENFPHPKRDNYLRSLLFFITYQPGNELIWPREIPYLDHFHFPSLRVLYLYGVDFKHGKFPKGVEKLIYLRYLSFRDCYLKELPSSLSNFSYLQTLDLRVRKACEITIPDVFGNMERLKYLYLPLAYRCPGHGKKLDLGKLEELEIVVNFDPSEHVAEDLSKLTNLTDLSASIVGNTTALERILKYLKHPSGHLRWISLNIRNFDCYSEKRISVMRELFSCPAIHALGVEGRLGTFPEFDKISSKLTEIVLNGSELEDDPMQILQHLIHLQILVLETEAYMGKVEVNKKGEKIPKKMRCSSFGFPVLRYLKLSKLYELQEWEVENDAMKNLGTLAIQNCRNLQMIPEGLKFITCLKKLEIASMPPEFVSRIRKSDGTEGEDFYIIRPELLTDVKIDGQPLILKERQQARPGEDPQSSSML